MLLFQDSWVAIVSTLGTVIPSVIGAAIAICNFIIKAKQKGWRNINEEEWREFGQTLEKDFNSVLFAIASQNTHCDQCKQKNSKLNNQVAMLSHKVNQTRDKLVGHTNTKVEQHTWDKPKKKESI
ncbi:hypothetical protein MHLP_00125 [Candidatus Mycoplasma haematolamae str. Purdue]|uniref:Uncharacterized protein n=1 Tax=Mycoplasma haematolamae (strain Purdue) TaxID=1212765 RepID=I7B8Q2_MYCHA|nr:hypothetical protein [Candidatus Mycoplasma haematolamae]AFO51605.1 hypothetical protein MHLP_00125 [Candidatus Mycoplasma haematolamae str. Purdue]